MHSKRFLSFLLAMILLLSAMPVNAQSKKLSDVDKHWAKEYISWSVNKNIISGYPDGSFKPDNDISRAEFVRILNQFIKAKEITEVSFTDISGKWYEEEVKKAVKRGFVENGNSFNGDEKITRDEVFKMLSIVYNLKGNLATLDQFKDKDDISNKAQVAGLIEKGIVSGYPDKTIRTKNLITRAEICTLIFKSNEILGEAKAKSEEKPVASSNKTKSIPVFSASSSGSSGSSSSGSYEFDKRGRLNFKIYDGSNIINSGFEIKVDGEIFLNNSKIRPGKYNYSINMPGYKEYKGTVEINKNEEKNINISLTKIVDPIIPGPTPSPSPTPSPTPTGELKLVVDKGDYEVLAGFDKFTGSFETRSDAAIKNIYCVVTNEALNFESDKYQAMIDDTNKTWEIEKVGFLLGENTLNFTAEDMNGNKVSKSIKVTFKIEEFNTDYTEDQISEEDGEKFVNNILKVYLDKQTDPHQDMNKNPDRLNKLKEICEAVQGEVIGYDSIMDGYQIKVAKSTMDELFDLIDIVEAIDGVDFANIVTLVERGNIPNDPWGDDNEWTEVPSGNNWWAEAINLQDTWNFEKYFSPVKIGLVDGGVDNHEDIVCDNSLTKARVVADEHGTHVAGIMGASVDNGIGISGIVKNKELYGYDAYSGAESTDDISNGIKKQVLNGVKVINNSNGISYSVNTPPRRLKRISKEASRLIESLIKDTLGNEKFLIVQAAGNDGVDTKYNGSFCTMLSDPDVSEEIKNHAMSVVAADINNKLAKFSNYGYGVSIAAPGVNIYSTVTNNRYDYMDGTSMAAPMVSGVAGLVWSVNPELSSGEVKNILIETATKDVAPYHDQRIYKLLDAGAAVKRAADDISALGSIEGRFVNAVDGFPLSVDYKIFKVDSDEVLYSGKTNTDGKFKHDLEPGEYFFKVKGEIEGKPIISGEIKFIVYSKENNNLGDLPLSSQIDGNSYRIVLRWGQNPRDLDSHFYADTINNEKSHIWYSRMTDSYANLDIDDVTSYGPETITIPDATKLKGFSYSIHNFTDRYSEHGSSEEFNLAKSGAVVELYKGEGLVGRYEVPNNKRGTLWNVFSIDEDGSISVLNTMEFQKYPSNIGMRNSVRMMRAYRPEDINMENHIDLDNKDYTEDKVENF